MSDKSAYAAIGVSLILAALTGSSALGARDEKITNQQLQIDELKAGRKEIAEKLDDLTKVTVAIATRLDVRVEEEDRDERRRVR